ncbi:MAG TPA: hypothetical protein VGG75_35825 [Trebonia sp.]|jgi:hypothetical protein
MLFLSAAGRGSVLAVLAGSEADAGVVGYEMTQLVKSVHKFLETQPRIRGADVRTPDLPERLPPLGPS